MAGYRAPNWLRYQIFQILENIGGVNVGNTLRTLAAWLSALIVILSGMALGFVGAAAPVVARGAQSSDTTGYAITIIADSTDIQYQGSDRITATFARPLPLAIHLHILNFNTPSPSTVNRILRHTSPQPRRLLNSAFLCLRSFYLGSTLLSVFIPNLLRTSRYRALRSQSLWRRSAARFHVATQTHLRPRTY